MLLAFDTATPRASVALWDSEVIAQWADADTQRHGDSLAVGIAAVLNQAQISPAQLTKIAVGVGPGPFTGLRVGVVTGLTMAAALQIPVVGVCSLDIIAAELDLAEFAVAIDARRREVYFASYPRTELPQVLQPAELTNELPTAGTGPQLYPDFFPKPLPVHYPNAAMLAEMVATQTAQLLPVQPLYLRRPDVMPPAKPKRVS